MGVGTIRQGRPVGILAEIGWNGSILGEGAPGGAYEDIVVLFPEGVFLEVLPRIYRGQT